MARRSPNGSDAGAPLPEMRQMENAVRGAGPFFPADLFMNQSLFNGVGTSAASTGVQATLTASSLSSDWPIEVSAR
jgi:hypothetical protein